MKRILVVMTTVVIVAGLAAGLSVRATIKAVPRLFKRNAELKAQGYYMGEFEFKMVAVIYYLNEGSYLKAYSTLQRIRNEMDTTEGLVKMPQEMSPEEMMTFLLERQNPVTGAFMDSSYPFFTYVAPTLNVVDALDDLARKSGQPLKLKYPLRFLDRINTPEHLRAYLDSLLYVKEIWAGMAPVGPYGPGVSELAYFNDLERRGLYQFSDEWKDAFRQWIYETQDPVTGFWGFRIGSPGKWRPNDSAINSTYHILQALVLKSEGENQSQKYPLRYAGELARSILKVLDKPVPDNSAHQHAWCLDQSQGARTITMIWAHLTEPEKEQARMAMQTYLTTRYRCFFRPADGAFSLYTSDNRADVDGTSTALRLLQATGSLSSTWERQRLWGKAIAAPPELVRVEVHRWEEAALPASISAQSLRVYKDLLPVGDSYDDANLVLIIYPGDSPILDVMELRQCIAGFIAMSGQSFGNWKSKEQLREEPLDLHRKIKAIPISRKSLDLARIGKDCPDARRFYVIGYDPFQVPVFRVEFLRSGA